MRLQTVAFAAFLIASLCGADEYTVTYRVNQAAPSPKMLAHLTVSRKGPNSYVGEVQRETNEWLYSEAYALYSETGADGRQFSFVQPPQSVGGTMYVPLFPDDTTGVRYLRSSHSSETDRRLIFSAIDPSVKQPGDRPYYTPVRADYVLVGSRPRVTEVRFLHDGKVASRWKYEKYRALGNLRLPERITRFRYKASGLNIPHDDQVEWSLESASEVGDPRVALTSMLDQGASVQDNRDPKNITAFSFEPHEGGLLEQVEWSRANSPPQLVVEGTSKVWVIALAGLVLGGAAIWVWRRQVKKVGP